MDTQAAIEVMLNRALATADYPRRLAEAMHYAVFSGGARLRPQLCMAVAAACGAADSPAALAMATSVELLHCASLVHDDLPCFDDAAVRRGKPTVHRQYGENTAVLVGDALIVAAYGWVSQIQGVHAAVLRYELSRAGSRLVAGQAWEEEADVDLTAYHAAKTGALFEAATVGGAYGAGGDGERWRSLGSLLGQVYQLADDLADQHEDSAQLNMVQAHGAQNVHASLGTLLAQARSSVPHQGRRAPLDGWFDELTARIVA